MLQQPAINLLANRAIIEVTGPESKGFLQGLITNNIYNLPIYSLMLNPQGRFLYDFFIVEHDECLFIDCYLPQILEIINSLERYKLRRKISIKNQSAQFKVLSHNQIIPHALLNYHDPRNHIMGYRAIISSDKIDFAIDEFAKNYHKLRYQLGIAECQDMIFNKSFPLEFAMDKINAIDFDKGCYIGQEVTSRTKHRGTIRKKIYLVEGINLLEPHSQILIDHEVVGTMCSNNGKMGLALIKEDYYDKISNLPTKNDLQIIFTKTPYDDNILNFR